MKIIGKIFRGFGRGLRNGLVALGALAFLGTSIGIADYLLTQGSGTTFASIVISSKHYAALVICDMTVGESNCSTVKAASTPAAQTDTAVVMRNPDTGTTTDSPCTLPATGAACSQIAVAKAQANTLNTGVVVTSSALPSGGSTSANQSTQITAEQATATVLGTTSDSPYNGTGNSTASAALRGIYAALVTGSTPVHFLSAATNNSTVVKNAAGTLYDITIIQTTTTLGDFRLYDSASAPTCSSATGVVGNYAVQSNAVSPGLHLVFGATGKKFSNGVSFCLTGAIADNDNTNFVTGVQINADYQ